MRLLLLPLALGQSLVLGQATTSKDSQETVQVVTHADSNPITVENVEVGGVEVHEVLGVTEDGKKVEESLPGLGTVLKVNLTPSFRNNGLTQEDGLLTVNSVNNHLIFSDLLGSQHPANRPEYFTASEFTEPSVDHFPRTLGQTQILGRDQVLTRGGESDQQDLTLGLAPSVTPQSDYLGISYPKSDYLAAVEYLQPQVVTKPLLACLVISR